MSSLVSKILSLNNFYHLPSLVLGIFCMYSGVNTYLTYKQLRNEYRNLQERYERSNCVVTYAPGLICGWPPNTERARCSMEKWMVLLEPIIYFINVTEKTLDIAVMMITVDKYLEALICAKQRRVKIRIISQYEKNSHVLTRLRYLGVPVTFFVSTEDQSPKLLHYKYMVRDFGTANECVCMGSMNYTLSGATDNYENVVFTQVPSITENFHNNFEECLKLISEDNESLYKKSILINSRLI